MESWGLRIQIISFTSTSHWRVVVWVLRVYCSLWSTSSCSLMKIRILESLGIFEFVRDFIFWFGIEYEACVGIWCGLSSRLCSSGLVLIVHIVSIGFGFEVFPIGITVRSRTCKWVLWSTLIGVVNRSWRYVNGWTLSLDVTLITRLYGHPIACRFKWLSTIIWNSIRKSLGPSRSTKRRLPSKVIRQSIRIKLILLLLPSLLSCCHI